jgi:hypothetical protein
MPTPLWFSRGSTPDDPARWQPPAGFAQPVLEAAVFFVHPTSYFDRAHWNASLQDKALAQRAETFVRALPALCQREIWAPRYRGHAGPFTNKPEAPAQARPHRCAGRFDHALEQIDLPRRAGRAQPGHVPPDAPDARPVAGTARRAHRGGLCHGWPVTA